MRLLFLFALLCVLPLRADILANGNFSDGHAHWKGDVEASGTDNSIDLASSSSNTPGGLVIKLKKDKWNKISQTFTIRNASLYYSLTFQLSNDYKLGSDSIESLSSPDLTDIEAIGQSWPMRENSWHILIVSGGSFYSRSVEVDASKLGDTQTVTGKISDLPTESDAVLVLCLPPGKGSVTLLNVALSTKDLSSQP